MLNRFVIDFPHLEDSGGTTRKKRKEGNLTLVFREPQSLLGIFVETIPDVKPDSFLLCSIHTRDMTKNKGSECHLLDLSD